MGAGQRITSTWALLGVAALFGFAIARLGARGVEAIVDGLAPMEWAALAACFVVFVFGEGVLALQRRWVPRVVGRVRGLMSEESRIARVLAPLYAMSLIFASRREMMRAWAMVLSIALLAFAVQRLPNPWRGIIDFSVAAALAWALVVLVAAVPGMSTE